MKTMTKEKTKSPLLHTAAAPANDTIERSEFATAMRGLPSGVVVITSYVDDKPWGVTLSSLSSFSAEPARVSFSILRTTATAAHIRDHGTLGVAILSSDAGDLAARQAAAGQPKFLNEDDLLPQRGQRLGMPLVVGAVMNLECQVAFYVEVLDHLLVVADVVSAVGEKTNDCGLLYWNRTFGHFEQGVLA
ncbi:flavin reductase family protein [Citricoccus sp. I39-566]|uniref:flavin reductase family protein n=1 Tax=Citricoccus sp. I39-566 TaxID=3073268 RepID=UPI00286A0DDF|nr:flavin reductase family protein [Citricoccus sp. I39-566]WMY78751.1 flavin reductase family protein [Citricoccus sp. I39-566]